LKRSIVVFSFLLCGLASYGFGQVQIDQVLNPTGEAIGRLKTAPDGRLWVFTRPLTIHQTPGPGTLLAQIAAAPTAPLQKVAENTDGDSFDQWNVNAGIAYLGGFFPENGNTVTLSPFAFFNNAVKLNFKDLDIQASITPAGIQSLCTDYVAADGKTLKRLCRTCRGLSPPATAHATLLATTTLARRFISVENRTARVCVA
jgi:hypothetical protein